MIQKPMDIVTQFPVRKFAAQKHKFRNAVSAYAEELGYPVQTEQGSQGCRNIVMGNPESAEFLVTAHYDTPALNPFSNIVTPYSRFCRILRKVQRYSLMLPCSLVLAALECVLLAGICALLDDSFAEAIVMALTVFSLPLLIPNFVLVNYLRLHGVANPNNVNDNTSGVVTLLEIMRTLPENQRQKVCFVLFDMEELGLVGSKSYRKTHSEATDRQFVLNMDCVGDGDLLTMIPTKPLLNDRRKLTSLYQICGYFGKKSLLVCEDKNVFYLSDQNSFPYGVGIVALSRHKRYGLYLDKIHTKKDTILEETNINILRAALTSYISCSAVNLERK